MGTFYLWMKALHVMAFAAWMAGLWYLPRLFVYHSQVPVGGEASEKFKIMERRLLKAICTPALIATWVFGLIITVQGGHLSGAGWLHAKIALLLLLSGTHGMMARHVRQFGNDERPRSEVYFRAFNEAPTVLFILIVILAVIRPF
ncbi:MAG: protoporphyrinogen oxidase HemJ [Geminicoccaceae bacterium]